MNSGRQAFSCEAVIVDNAELPQHAVIVEAGRVVAVVPAAQLPASLPHTKLPGAYLAPGLVDIHVHGAGGRGYNEADEEANRVIGQILLRSGITTALPTLASDTVERLLRAIPLVLNGSGLGRPRLPGVHLEGPYLAAAQAGAQDPAALRQPSDGSLCHLLARSKDIALMVVAPELPGAGELISKCKKRGIVVAAGHSDGVAADLHAGQARGLSHVTHLYSGQSSTTRQEARRVPGMLEASLNSDELTVELIADGHHVPDLLMQLAYRCLAGRLCLVSDASPGAGLEEGSEYQMAQVRYRVEGGVGKTLDGQSFGGSTTLLPAMLPIARAAMGLSAGQAVAMATSIPARAAHLAEVGLLAPGYHADFVLLDEQLHPLAVALGGTWQSTGEDRHAPQEV